MWVVKLGGSLEEEGQLRNWASTLAETPVPLIIVPGGGGFADRVRDAQQRLGIDDATAHRMAILAMEQTAHLICGMSPALIPKTQTDRTTLGDSGANVWFPARELLWDGSIPHSWDVTSDSLAAILARRIGADGLILVKSVPLRGRKARVHDLQEDGILDRAFADYGRKCGCPVWLVEGRASGEVGGLMSGRVGDALVACFDRIA